MIFLVCKKILEKTREIGYNKITCEFLHVVFALEC